MQIHMGVDRKAYLPTLETFGRPDAVIDRILRMNEPIIGCRVPLAIRALSQHLRSFGAGQMLLWSIVVTMVRVFGMRNQALHPRPESATGVSRTWPPRFRRQLAHRLPASGHTAALCQQGAHQRCIDGSVFEGSSGSATHRGRAPTLLS